LKTEFKEIQKTNAILHLKKCFGYALAQNEGNITKLASTLRCIPDHFFNRHENCGIWCHRNSENHSKKQKIIFKNPALYDQLTTMFSKYAKNAHKFSIAASSQANESFNNIMAHKAPKNICYSRSESCCYRLASAVCTKNDGESYLTDVEKKLLLSPGKHTKFFASQLDKIRKKRSLKSKLPSTKYRRNLLVRERENLRKKNESSEGVQYQSNCGFTENNEDLNIFHETQFADLPTILLSADTCTIVYFDLETSGFHKYDEILQIAAKCDRTFCVYVNPTKDINAHAFRHTGLQNIAGELFLHGKKVLSVPLKNALDAFQQFLNLFSKPCLLVAHNAGFDTTHLLRAILKHSMIADFKIIAGFSDTLELFKKHFPKRKGEGKFKLCELAKDYLNINSNESFHEALYDVEILEKLSAFIDKKDLYTNCKSYMESIIHVKNLQKTATTLSLLKPLKGIISNGMLRKIASQRITFEVLKEEYDKKGKDGLV